MIDYSKSTVSKKFVLSVPSPITPPAKPGNLFHQIRIATIAMRNPLEAISQRAFEEPVTQREILGQSVTVISDPEMIKYVFVDHPKNYHMHKLRQTMFKRLLGEGLFTAEGEHWKRSRKALAPIFVPKNIATFTKGMRETIEKQSPKLIDHTIGKSEPVKLGSLLTAMTYFALSDALFSGEISNDSEEILNLLSDVLENLGTPALLDLLGAPAAIPRLGKLKGQLAVKRLRRLITLSTRKRQNALNNGEKIPNDFLALMLSYKDENQRPFSEKEIEDQMMTFIGAGHETTAQALTWTFYLLSQDVEARERVEAEIDALDMEDIPAGEWGNHMPWTIACFEETLRLFPPASVLYRSAKGTELIKDTTVPANSGLMVHLWVLHRHKRLWEHPDAFNPDRFFGDARKKDRKSVV